MAVMHANEGNFKEMVAGDLVLVDFFATWCGPCKMLGPVLEELDTDRSGINIVKVDIDESRALAQQYGVMSVPTLFLMKNGQVVSQKSGFMPKEMLTSWIEESK
ncbi:MAG: thioredoxin [Bacilli bacterium]|jgi:thioredoxin 1|nr:thioredoxin [Bacilli bacterium]